MNLPDVKMEKTQQFVAGIENFDPTKLKRTETNEKNPLPDKDGKLFNSFLPVALPFEACN